MPHVTTADGLRIHYEAAGDGTPVLLLHPNHATSHSWVALGWFETLTAMGCRAIALDARGFGASDAVTDAAGLAPGSSSRDIAAVLDALEIEAAHGSCFVDSRFRSAVARFLGRPGDG